MHASPPPAWVALLGASAGGLDPLREFVAAMPRDERLACVVAQHLASAEASTLARLLQHVTNVPVQEAQDGVRLRGGIVYVTPPGHHVELEGHRLRLHPSAPHRGPAPSLDRLFASAARTLGRHAVAIVLSGTGQDGAVGARVLREAGGAVWAETPTEAPFASMPQTIVERGLADHVDTAAGLGRRLGMLLQEPPAPTRTGPHTSMADEREAMAALLTRLSRATGLDLSQYQETTLRRQFERVMRQRNLDGLQQLLAATERDPQLLHNLMQSVTIGVTEWLRDPSAFGALRVALREQIQRRAASGATSLRLWSVGCSTGEEAYGLAMLSAELLDELGLSWDWTVLGTDVNGAALDQARSGIFDEDSARALPAPWRQRHFTRIGHTLRIQQELRRHVVFARHDVVQDLPFLRMDLVACRNVLIYLKASAKDEVLRRLHRALLPDGLLMLGRSESLTPRTRSLFASLATHEHLWRKRADVGEPTLNLKRRFVPRAGAHVGDTVPTVQLRSVDRLEGDLRERLLQHLIERHAPPTVLLDRDGHPLHVVGSMEGLMRWPAGSTVALTLPNLVEPAWRRDVQLVLHRLLQGEESALRLPLPQVRGLPAYVLLAARFEHGGEPYAIVSFARAAPAAPEATSSVGCTTEASALAQERLESLVDALEHSQQQLQQLNEQLSVTSEELEAANEELEASNEELEASNEELRTLNEELDRSLREQQQLNELLHAVQESAGTALLVLDQERRLLRFNQLAADLIGLRETQLGMPWSFDTRRFAWPPGLIAHVVGGHSGAWQGGVERANARLWVQLVPWQTHDQRTGYVVALTDLTALRQAEQARLALQERLSLLTDALHEGVMLLDVVRGRIDYASPRLDEWLPAPATETGRDDLAWLLAAIAPQDQGRVQATWHDERNPQWTQRYRLCGPDGQWRDVQERGARVATAHDGRRLVAASLLDVTDRVQLEQRERIAHSRLQAVRTTPALVLRSACPMARCRSATRRWPRAWPSPPRTCAAAIGPTGSTPTTAAACSSSCAR